MGIKVFNANFYPRSPCGERPWARGSRVTYVEISIHALLAESDVAPVLAVGRAGYFYPRSPCGERLQEQFLVQFALLISIHALLAESDLERVNSMLTLIQFLSTLSLRRATDSTNANLRRHRNFYPRSPCGERRVSKVLQGFFMSISIHALLAESDQANLRRNQHQRKFLSTLSLRRATLSGSTKPRARRISIHALLAESDTRQNQNL